MTPDDRDPNEQLSREETERGLWEKHRLQLKELEELLSEEKIISSKFDHIFQELLNESKKSR